jgi:NADPH2:quinone reductase
MMRAMVIDATGPASVFREGVLPMPQPGPGEVRLRVMASSVNPVDVKIRAGAVALAPAFPAVLHGDVAGVIDAVGAGVTEFRAGDRVFGLVGGVRGCPGALAEFLCADARLLALMPDSLDFAGAAALPVVALTAYEALYRRTDLAPGASVLVQAGTGGVGHVAVQMARARGLRVAATVSGEAKAAMVRRLGADEAVNYRDEAVAGYVQRLTGGRGFDLVIDTVGGDNLEKSFAAARHGGEVVCVAARGTHDLSLMHGKGLSLHVVFKLLPLLSGEGREQLAADLRVIALEVEAGRLQPLIDPRRFAFDDVAAAHAFLESGRAVGKVVLTGFA